MNIVQFQRRPFVGQFSIEGLFACLRDEMLHVGCQVEPFEVPHVSKGFVRRVLNSWSAFRNQGEVNHITGDIHYVALFLPGSKTILTIHDCHTLERLTGLKRWLFKLFWFDLPVRRVTAVTVISDEGKRQLLRYVSVPEEKVQVVPNAVSSTFGACPRSFNTDCPRILQIGTKENKNLPRLIQALAGVPCHLRIIGRLNQLQSKELQTSGLRFSSATDLSDSQMYDEYCESDVVAFVSTYEGFGMPILEGNAVGRPVVTSDISSMTEVAGSAACLVDPFDVTSIREGIVRVIKDQSYREGLVQSGFDNVRRYNIGEVAQQYMALYDKLAGEVFPIGVADAAQSPIAALQG